MSDQELEYRRRNIDRIDRTITALVAERVRVTYEIADLLTADAAYQGAPGAFSEDAALELVGPAARLLPCPTLAHVFEAVASGQARSAVVPIENSLAGEVPGCAKLMARYAVHIAAECVRPIRHALIGAPGSTIESIRKVRSHPMALAQCERFLQAHPSMTPVAAFDTAGAVAEIVADGLPTAAAIASARAARIYGAVAIVDDIQDRPDNRTRFLLLKSRNGRATDGHMKIEGRIT
ncbi:MAG TPA: prephenate dehydratase domain-containing protein [Vicinamibacterales bacterium]|nr:prephenate dehydratase domain-containing protein [Vicinamibacterales bacterium]